MDDDKLYIPYGLSIDQEYFPGFGGRELRQFFVGILGSGIIGALLLIFTGRSCNGQLQPDDRAAAA